jgi:hypothetical protein
MKDLSSAMILQHPNATPTAHDGHNSPSSHETGTYGTVPSGLVGGWVAGTLLAMPTRSSTVDDCHL